MARTRTFLLFPLTLALVLALPTLQCRPQQPPSTATADKHAAPHEGTSQQTSVPNAPSRIGPDDTQSVSLSTEDGSSRLSSGTDPRLSTGASEGSSGGTNDGPGGGPPPSSAREQPMHPPSVSSRAPPRRRRKNRSRRSKSAARLQAPGDEGKPLKKPEENEAEKTGNGATSAPANSQQAVSTGSSKVFDGNTTSSLCPAGGGQRNVGRRAERPQASSSVTATEGAGCNCAHEATPTGHPSNAQAQSTTRPSTDTLPVSRPMRRCLGPREPYVQKPYLHNFLRFRLPRSLSGRSASVANLLILEAKRTLLKELRDIQRRKRRGQLNREKLIDQLCHTTQEHLKLAREAISSYPLDPSTPEFTRGLLVGSEAVTTEIEGPEARRGRITQLVKEHREALLLSLLSDEWIPNYTGLLYRQSVCWQLPLTEVQHIHNVFYEYLNDYHFAMHTQELCLGLWDHNPRLMLPGEQALGGEWVKKVLSQAAITPQQQESQRRIRNLQRLHLEIKEIQLEEYRQSLRALLRLPPVIEPSPTSRAQ